MDLKKLKKLMNKADFVPLISLHKNIGVKTVKYVKPWKPTFTAAEVKQLAQLGKAEKKAKVKQLYAKYLAEKTV